MTAADASRSQRRLEDRRFLVGEGRYVEDFAGPGALHAQVLRSPHAHAEIAAIDTAAARAVPGVAGVFTEADLRGEGLGNLPCIVQVPMLQPLVVPPRPALARGRVRHVGDPVAFVVAENAAAAREAAERIEVAYDPLPAVVGAAAALAEGAPQLWTECPGNRAFRFERGDRAATEAAFARAAHVVELELVNNRVVVAPLEPRAAIGSYDAASDTLDLLVTGQDVHAIRDQLAKHVFHLAPERVQVRAPDVGGGFGMKNFLYPEWVLVLWAARRLGRPVKWVAERGEDFVSDTQGRDNRTRGRLALDAEGRFLALEVATVANLGAYLSSAGPISSTMAPSNAMGGVYAIPAAFMAVRGAYTNTVPIDAYRGAGKPEANYLIERLVEAAAVRLEADPLELRRRNMIAEFPYRNAMGVTIDGGRFAALLDRAAALADRAGFEARRRAARLRGRYRGLGIACFLETSRGAPNEGAEIRFEADGRIALIPGTQSNGQGHETSFVEIAAGIFGLPLERFRYVQADTRLVRSGAGHGGARSLHMGGTALVMAAEAVLAKGTALAAHLLQAEPAQVRYAAGRFTVAGSERAMALDALARAALDPANLPEGMTPALDCHAMNICDRFTFPNGCHFAEVEVDPETGAVALERYTAVDDYGRLVNAMLTEGQVHGGLAQGVGQALLEHTVYDAESGQLLSGSFMDYALPRAADLPNFALTLDGVATANNPLGVKGVGQAGCIAAPQTVINAVLDALAPLGVRHIDMPATPERVWQAIRGASAN